MSWHMRSVRARILLLVLIPVLALLGLSLFIMGIVGKDALNLARARALKSTTNEPVNNFIAQLDTERVFALTACAHSSALPPRVREGCGPRGLHCSLVVRSAKC